MDCSIIIVNYNTEELVINCIKSIVNYTENMRYEIIVVDNASVDNSIKLIKSNYPEVIVIQADKNLGFGKANNLGASMANGKYLFFLNSDTVLLNNAIHFFYEHFERSENSRLGCLGGKLLDENLKINGTGGKFPRLKYFLKNRISAITSKFLSPINNSNGFIIDVDYILGADMFLPTEVFSKGGGFDERFFMYFEESDLQLRLAELGYVMKIIDGPQIMHLEGKSNHNSIKKIMMVQNSAFKYYLKNRPYWEYLVFRQISFWEAFTFLFKSNYSFKDFKEYLRFNLQKI